MRLPITFVIALISSLFAQAAKPVVIAHRGASGYLPEHTLEAKALAHAMGADFLEQDVVLTKDDVPIVMHDIHLETISDVAKGFPDRKRADGHYYAIDFMLTEVKHLHANERINIKTGKAFYPNRFPLGASSFQIPTLEEELQFIQGLNKSTGRIAGIYPEIKQPAFHRKEGHDISAIVLPILRKYGYATKKDPCWIQCFEFDEVKRIRTELGWEGMLLLLGGKDDPTLFADVAKYADGIGPALGAIVTGKSKEDRKVTNFMKHAHEANLIVHPYTLRADELPKWADSMDDALDVLFGEAHLDGLFSDFPDQVVKWLAKHEKHK